MDYDYLQLLQVPRLKNIWIILFGGGVLCACTSDRSIPAVGKNIVSSSIVPGGLLTADSLSWCASSVASTGYDADLAGEYYKAENKRGRLVQVNFNKEGWFRFLLHEKHNPVSGTETMSMIEGTVEFIKGKSGRNVLVTHPQKGCYFKMDDGACNVYPITGGLLEGYYSASYLWEYIFSDIPSADFMLLVDIKEHPEADSKQSGIIKKSWISKFYSRKTKPSPACNNN